MTNHFTFFESYYSSVKDLDNDLKAQFFDVLFQYALYNEDPKDDTNAVVKALFTLVKPNLDGSKKRREAGKQGGSKTKAKVKQNKSKSEANENQVLSDKDKEKEKDKEIGNKKFTPPTLEDVIIYQKEKCHNVDAKYFFDYFEETNWIDSRGNKVKSWKQKMLTWNKSSTKTTSSVNSTSGYIDPRMGGYN